MKNNTFWQDAARGGAILAAIQIFFAAASHLMNHAAGTAAGTTPSPLMLLLSVLLAGLQLVVLCTAFYLLTKRRSLVSGDAGFTYGQGLGFIVAMGLCAGVLLGAWEILARNIFFHDVYEVSLNQMLTTYRSLGIMTTDQLATMQSVATRVMFSAPWVLLTTIISSALGNLFYGLIVAIFTRRPAQISDSEA